MGSEYPNISVENETSSAPLLSLKDVSPFEPITWVKS